MTRSTPRPAAAEQVALSAAFSRAVDLSALKRPAESPRSAPAAAPDGAAAPPANPYVIDVSEATFGPDVVEKSMQVLVVVDLWAEWCQPCKQLSPLLERVVGEYGGAVILAKVDVDANPRISQAFGVQSIPTVVAIAGGQPIDAFSGALPEPQVRAWIQRLVDALKTQLPGMSEVEAEVPPAVVDPLIEQAEQAMEEGDFDGAIAAYERYSANNPADTDAILAIAQLRFQQRVLDLPADAVQRAEAEPGNVQAQLDAAALLFASGRPEEAYEKLIADFAALADDDRGRVHKQLLELFELQGQSDPVVIKYRRRLAAAMY